MAHGKNKDNIDVYWLHGTIYKTGKRPHRWLVPPLVKVAVDVLTRLTAPLREQLRQEEADIKARIGMSIASERLRLVERFDTVSKHKDKLFLARSMSTKGGSISVLSGRAMSVDLKDFCANLGIHDKDGQPYALHAHQFRRTYAYFMARSRFGDPLTLRAHFGHYSWDMTAVYMDDGIDGYEADIELLNMVEMFMLDLHNDISRRLADSDDSMANGGQWLTELRKVVRTSKNKEEVIREFAGSITIAGNGYAYCIGNPNDRGCGGLCILEPQMCLDCNCGVIMQEHRPVWQAIRDQQMEVLELDDVGLGGRARAQKILAAAEKVLCLLDEKD
jgi:hypothetical protein